MLKLLLAVTLVLTPAGCGSSSAPRTASPDGSAPSGPEGASGPLSAGPAAPDGLPADAPDWDAVRPTNLPPASLAVPAPVGTGLPVPTPLAAPASGARPGSPAPPAAAGSFPARVLAAARAEVARKAGYDAKYCGIAYPGGDVPGGGVCTDLVVRALRGGGVDLQKLVHEDMLKSFSSYPPFWGLTEPDSNIDHRRVPNLMAFFKRRGKWLDTGTTGAAAAWQPGDVVFWDLGQGGRSHCGIVSDRKGASGLPTVVHNLGGAAEEDCLTRWKITGHARWVPFGTPAPSGARAAQPEEPDDDEAKG